jgi:hypothetical protein
VPAPTVFPLQQAAAVYGEDVLYRLLDYLFTPGIAGVSGATDLQVQQYHSGARMSVEINPGGAIVAFNSPAGGKRTIYQSALTDSGTPGSPNGADFWSETFVAADGTNPRIDRVVVQVQDSILDGSGVYRAIFRVVAGTPWPGATLANGNGAPAVPANSLQLANVLVPAGATTVTTANIQDTRVFATLGGVIGAPALNRDYQEQATNQGLTSGTDTEAAPKTIITFASMTFDGATAVDIDVGVPYVTTSAGTNGGAVNVWANGANQGRLLKLPDTNVSGYGLYHRRRFVLPAGTYSVLLRAWTNGGNQTLQAGSGTASNPPVTASIRRV